MTRLTRRSFLAIAGAAGAGSMLTRPAGATTMTYDDGNFDIPGGVTGPVERVIIVGAGFAGLVVANALRAGGVQAVVIEGRNRIGGRVRTENVGGVPLDLGAAWIHGPIGNPLSDWAAQSGISLLEADPFNSVLSGYDPSIGSISPMDSELALEEASDFPSARFALRSILGPNASVDAGINTYLDFGAYSPDERRVIDFMIRSLFVELPYGASAHEMSLDEYFDDSSFSGADHVPVGGYAGLIDALNDQLDIRLGETVTDIDSGPGGVTVTTDSDVHTGSHVVVTAPVGVLKAGTISFSPGLPSAKTEAIANLGMGNFEKIYLQFSTAFWDVTPLRENAFYVSDTAQGEYPVFLDWTDVAGGVPTLSCNVGGDFAATLTGLSEAAITARLTTILGEIFPGVAPALRTPIAVARSDWGGDPFSRGSYPFLPVGALAKDLEDLADPVDGRVLFAGDATDSNYYGSAHGAMISGIREAKRLLAKPSVELPEPGSWLLQGVGFGALLWLARRRLSRGPSASG